MAKNNKKSKQKKSVLNKLGGLSKRSKFIVVVLIFAVLGGGYLTYKSFAATAGPSSSISVGANLRFSGDTGCTSNKVNDPGKNNLTVMQIYCPPKKAWSVNSNYTTNSVVTWPQGTYKNCVVAKGVGKFSITQGGKTEFNAGVAYYDINSPDYKTYCSYAVTIGSPGLRFFSSDSGTVANYDRNNDRATLLTISSITRTWYAPGVAPAPGGK